MKDPEEQPKEPVIMLRTLAKGGELYIHRDDIATFITSMAETEETDVRERFREAAYRLNRLQIRHTENPKGE